MIRSTRSWNEVKGIAGACNAWMLFMDESSALKGPVRGFISSPLSFPVRLSSVDWPSWRSKRHERSFQRFPLRKRLLSYSCFNSCLIFSSWVQLSDSTSAWGRSEELLLQLLSSKRDLRRRRDMSGRLKFSFGLCIFF